MSPQPGPDKTLDWFMSGTEARLQTNTTEAVTKPISDHSDRILQGTNERLAQVKQDVWFITDNLECISVTTDDLKYRMNLLEARFDDREHYRHKYIFVRCTAGLGSGPCAVHFVFAIIGIHDHDILYHFYADETELQTSCPPAQLGDICDRLFSCVDDIREWSIKTNLNLMRTRRGSWR